MQTEDLNADPSGGLGCGASSAFAPPPSVDSAQMTPPQLHHSPPVEYDANQPPNSRLFVVCSKSLTESDVREVFSAFGDIQDVYIIRDKNTRASKGVCFIKYFKTSDACRAMEELNGKQIKNCDRPIKVLIAQSRGSERNGGYASNRSSTTAVAAPPASVPGAAPLPSAQSGGGGGTEEDVENLLRLFVTVDKNSSSDHVKNYFSQFGLVDHVHILKDKETQESRGVAYVKFYKASHAALALENCALEYKAILADPRPVKSQAPSHLPYQNPIPLMKNQAQYPITSQFTPHQIFSASGPGSQMLPPLLDGGTLDQSQPPWQVPPPHDSFDHFSVACRSIGFNSCRIQAFVDISSTEDQLRPLFDIVPGMESFHLSIDQRKGVSSGVAYISYNSPVSALYAREKLNGLEFPPGFRIIVKLLDDVNAPRYNPISQALSAQMARSMTFGVNNGLGFPSSGVMQNKNAPNGVAMGTGDTQETENPDVRMSYLFPTGGAAYPSATAPNVESYPSFTSSSSGGSGNAGGGGTSVVGSAGGGVNDATGRKRRGNNSVHRFTTPSGWSYTFPTSLPKALPLTPDGSAVRAIQIQPAKPQHPLPHHEILQDLFCRFGNLVAITAVPGGSAGTQDNVLYATYSVLKSAENVLRTVNGATIEGCTLKLSLCEADSTNSRLL